MAKYISAAGLGPKRGKDVTPEMYLSQVILMLQKCDELGVPYMAGIAGMMVVNGRVSLWGHLFTAVVRRSSVWDEQAYREWNDGETWFCQVGRKGCKPLVRSFSISDAKTARLWGKDGPWAQYPQRMLTWRVRNWAMSDCFSDILMGDQPAEDILDQLDLDHSAEDLQRQSLAKRAAESRMSDAAKAARIARPKTSPIQVPQPDTFAATLGSDQIEDSYAAMDRQDDTPADDAPAADVDPCDELRQSIAQTFAALPDDIAEERLAFRGFPGGIAAAMACNDVDLLTVCAAGLSADLAKRGLDGAKGGAK